MVIESNAVVDPRAVVVKAFTASIADTAVTRPVSSDYLTVRAQEYWIELLHHLHERHFKRFLNEARISAHGDSMEYSCNTKETEVSVDEVLLAYVNRKEKQAEVRFHHSH